MPRVVIVGGGFGGLEAAKALGGEPVDATVVDRRNHHLFQPLLYQVATAGLSPADISAPIRAVLRRWRNIEVVLAEARAVDAAGRRLVLADGEIAYDFLILAAGATHSYFGHDDWRPLAPGLKTVEDATELRRRILLAFERAERAHDGDARRAELTFVVVGGGPTGVELAGAIAELARHALARDFRHIDPTQARVVLLEAGPRILASFPDPLPAEAGRALARIGVDVRTATIVTAIDGGGVTTARGRIASRVVVWAAGVQASPLGRSLGAPLDRAGRVLVEPDLSVPGHPEVFAIGDLACFTHQTGGPLPGTSPVAMQQGRAAAANLLRSIRGEPRRPFRYRDKGTMATIGRSAAVAVVGPVKLAGFVAWLAWLVVHIYYLIGFRNRLLVLLQWAWAYVTFQRGARLITHNDP